MSDKDSQKNTMGGIPIPGETASSQITTETSADGEAAGKKGGRRPPSRKRAWPIKLAAALALLGLLFFACGYLLVPHLTENALTDKLAKRLQRKVTLAKVEFDPFTLTLTVRNLLIGPQLSGENDRVDPLLSVAAATIDFEFSSLFSGKTVARAFTAEQFFLHLVRQKDGRYNFIQIINDLLAERSTPLRYSVNNISFTESRIIFDDEPTGKTHTIEEIDLAIPSFSNISYQAGQYIKPRFSAKINGSPLNLAGETSMDGETMQASLDLKFEDVDLPRYLPYLPETLRLKIAKGAAEFNGRLVFSLPTQAEARLNLEGEGTITNLAVKDLEGNLNSAEKITFKGSLTPLENRYSFQEIEISGPKLFIDRNRKGNLNFPIPFPGGEDAAANLVVGQLLLHDGVIHFNDRKVQGGFHDTWTDLQLSIKDYNPQGKTPAAFSLSGKGVAKSSLSGQGTILAGPLRAEGLLVVNQMDLGRLSPYAAQFKNLKITGGVATGIESRFTWTPALGASQKTGSFTLSGLSADIRKLTLAREKEEWLRLPVLRLSEAELKTEKKSINLGKIKTENGLLLLSWDKEGAGNWQAATPAGQQPGWDLTLAGLSTSKSTIILRGAGARLPAFEQRLERVDASIQMQDIATKKGIMTLTATTGGSAALSLEGPVQFSPLNAALTCRLEKLPVTALSPLLKGWLKPAVTAGLVQANGTIRLPEETFTGGISISSLAAGLGKNPIFAWQNAYTENFEINLKTMGVDIGHVFIDAPSLRWRREETSSMRAALFHSRPKPAESSSGFAFAIKEVSLNKGTLHFTDLRLAQPYEATVSEINGTITDINGKKESATRVDLNGIHNNKSPVLLTGDFNFFAPVLSADCKIGTSGVALSEISAYVAPVIGYQASAGTLKLVTLLKKQGNEQTTNTQITVSGLQLGAAADGNRLLPLTIALLANEQGDITLDIASSGDTSARDFSFSQGIAKHVQALLTKTGASPFALLGESLQNAAIPSSLAFKAGQTTPDDAHAQGLNSLAEALQRRPGLKLIISGSADLQADRKILFEKLLKQEEERRKKTDAQLSQKIVAAYGKEETNKNVNGKGAAAPEEKILDETSIKKEDLLKLAEERAHGIRQLLVDKLKISPKRLTLGQAKVLGPESQLPGKARVDFTLDRLGQ